MRDVNPFDQPTPPHNIEAEQAVLGAILLDAEAMDKADELLRGDEWFRQAHKHIFDAMRELNDSGQPIDLVTLVERLNIDGTLEESGGVEYLAELAGAVPTAANVEHYLGIVKVKAHLRQGLKETGKLHALAAETEDPGELAASLQAVADELSEKSIKKNPFKIMRDVTMSCYESIEKTWTNRNNGEVTGISSGFRDLDNMTAGFQRSDLIIVAARPSVGKTAFALNISQNVGVRSGGTVAIFSLEMSAEQLVKRMICAEGNVDASRLRTGFLEGDDWERVTHGIGSLSDAKIYIDDSAIVTVNEIRAKCRRLKKSGDLDLILIDYIQLIAGSGKRENRQAEVSEISRSLKQIARELEVPVIALSQLSRAVEQRQDKHPMLSDLRESGSLEQDADIVAFLYRDDYYNAESEKKNTIEIIIAKQRNGPVGTVELAFLKNYNKFVTLDHSQQEAEPSKPKSAVPDMWRKR